MNVSKFLPERAACNCLSFDEASDNFKSPQDDAHNTQLPRKDEPTKLNQLLSESFSVS